MLMRPILTIGGSFAANIQVSPFLCLLLKMLQIQPDVDVITEYAENEDFKYLRLLALFYLRIIKHSKDVYEILEPYLNDYRKVRRRQRDGSSLGGSGGRCQTVPQTSLSQRWS